MFKKSKALTALLLTVVILFGSVLGGVFALESDKLTNASDMTSVMPGELSGLTDLSHEFSDGAVIGKVAEVTSLRDENVKHFRLDNGTFEAVMYPYPVHRQDSDGVWQDIDNSLALKNDGMLKVYATSDSRVKFADSFKSNSELYSLSENGYSISMALIENEPLRYTGTLNAGLENKSKIIVSSGEKYSAEKAFDSLEQAAKINNKSSVLYCNVRANTDIQYILQENDIKENIIVKAPGESYEYRFGIALEGLTASLDRSGVINLYDAESGELKYIMPAPYMYDIGGEYSNDVSYDIQQLRDGSYLLTVSADEKWMNSKERVFPVTIDPTLTLPSSAFDSYTDKSNPDENYGLDEKMWVSSEKTAYIHMAVPNLPATATLNSATLHVPYYFNKTTGSLLAAAYQVYEVWFESAITYNNTPDCSTLSLSNTTLIASSSVTQATPGWAEFDITNAAVDWYADPTTNYGVAIKRWISPYSNNSSVILKSYESGSDWAYISVNYINYIPSGVYAFRSKLSSTRWIKVTGNSAGSYLQHVSLTNFPADAEVFDRSCLFKIYNVPGTVRYIIRSMLNNELTFDISGDKFVTKKISNIDSEVPPEDSFYINWDGYGFKIRPYYSDKIVNISSTSNPDLTTLSNADAGSGARWELVQYTGNSKRGYTLNPNTMFLKPGTEVTLSTIVWTTSIGYNKPEIVLNDGCSDVASLAWNRSTGMGKLVINKTGSFGGYIRILKEEDLSVYESLYFTYAVNVPVSSGDYFVMNKEAGKYMQLDDGDAPDFNNNGGIAEIHSFDGGDYQKWTFTHLGSGYYSIRSVVTGYALTVPPDKVTSDNVDLVLKPYTGSYNQKWKITVTNSGAYKIKAKSSESYTEKDLVMDLKDPAFSYNGLSIRQRENEDSSSYRDEWIIRKSNDYTLMYIGDYVGDPQMPPILSDVDTALRNNAGMSGYAYTSLNDEDLLGCLSTSSIFSCITHGDQYALTVSNGIITVNDINRLVDGALSNLEFVCLGACSVGRGGASSINMVNALSAKGAQNVLGFKENVIIPHANLWMKTFMVTLSTGCSVKDAMAVADDAVQHDIECLSFGEITTNEEYRYICGSDEIAPCN